MLQLTTILFLIAFSTLAVIHALALALSLYWHFWWFDIPMHMFGGVIVALGLFTLRDLRIISNRFLKLIPVLTFVFIVALVWEGYELLIGIPMESDYAIDTLADLTMGLLGAIVGYVIGIKLRVLA
jgi:hypothetical protein